MTDTTIINDIDQRIVEFERFITDACQHPLPDYQFDRDWNLHPWIAELRDNEAEIWMFLAEQIGPALHEARAIGTGEEDLLRRYQTLLKLVTLIEALIEQCQRRTPWMADHDTRRSERPASAQFALSMQCSARPITRLAPNSHHDARPRLQPARPMLAGPTHSNRSNSH